MLQFLETNTLISARESFAQTFSYRIHVKLMPLVDKIPSGKRTMIESVNDELKNFCQIQHTIHRSFFNWAINLLSVQLHFPFSPRKVIL